MSLESSYTTEIRIPQVQMTTHAANIQENPCLEILKMAMEKVARDHKGRIDSYYSNNRGERIGCFLSVHTPDFPYGVGAIIEDDGRVTFHYDAYRDKHSLGEKISNEINQNYVVIAVMKAQQRLGFHITLKENQNSSRRKTVNIVGIK